MEQMKALNGGKNEASRSMITFLAVNTSSITLVPTTVIAIRMTYGADQPTDIVGPTILATLISGIGAIMIDRYFHYRRSRRGDLVAFINWLSLALIPLIIAGILIAGTIKSTDI